MLFRVSETGSKSTAFPRNKKIYEEEAPQPSQGGIKKISVISNQ